MQSSAGITLLFEIGDFGRFLHDHLAEAVGEEVAHNVPVVILGSLELDGPQRPTELMARTGLSSGGMTKAIDRLELDGLVVRAADASDGRAFLIRITEEGSRVVTRMGEVLDAAIAAHPDRLEHFRQVLADT